MHELLHNGKFVYTKAVNDGLFPLPGPNVGSTSLEECLRLYRYDCLKEFVRDRWQKRVASRDLARGDARGNREPGQKG